MSEYSEQSDEVDAICPYCGLNYQVESEDYDNDLRVETCYGCGKKYYINQEFTVTTYTRPDCELNGEEHQFLPIHFENPKVVHCSVCDKVEILK